MSPSRIGLIGCGQWGANILRDLRTLGAQVHVVDTDAEARARALAGGAGSAGASVEGAPAVDGWVIATPATAHRGSIGSIAATGLPLLCEKPLAASLAEARAIADCVRGPAHLLDVWRYHPAVEALQRIVASGELGAVRGLRSTRANWTSPRTDVDSAWNLLPHELSTYRQVFGRLPEARSALAELEHGSVRSLWSHWSGPAWMASEVSNRSPHRRRELQLHCEHGVAHWSEERAGALELASGSADGRLEASDRRMLPLADEPALLRQLADWLRFLAGGTEPRSDLAYAMQVIERVERACALAGTAA